MPRPYSLTGKKSFDKLFKSGYRKGSQNFSLVYLPSQSTKIATIVTKKTVKKASSRNYAKRVMRDIIRKEVLPLFHDRPTTLAFICKTDLKTLKSKTPDFYKLVTQELLFLTKSI